MYCDAMTTRVGKPRKILHLSEVMLNPSFTRFARLGKSKVALLWLKRYCDCHGNPYSNGEADFAQCHSKLSRIR